MNSQQQRSNFMRIEDVIYRQSFLEKELQGIAHFLFEDALAARKALEAKGIAVLADREVLVQRLKQDQPGQLGKISRLMAEAGVNIDVIYSDHQNQLILVVDDLEKGRAVSDHWKSATRLGY